MNLWIVVVNRDDGNENSIDFETFPTKQKAVEAYEEWKEDLKAQCDDIGFTGDEGVYIAKVTDALLTVTETDEEEISFHFKWEEFKEKCNGFYLTEDAYMKLMGARGSMKGEWIPIKKEWPTKKGKYLVTYREWSNGDYLPKYDETYVRILRYSEAIFRLPVCIDKDAERDTNREVLAWMELPEIYEEGAR